MPRSDNIPKYDGINVFPLKREKMECLFRQSNGLPSITVRLVDQYTALGAKTKNLCLEYSVSFFIPSPI